MNATAQRLAGARSYAVAIIREHLPEDPFSGLQNS